LYLEEFIADVEAAYEDMYNQFAVQIMAIESGVSRGLLLRLAKSPRSCRRMRTL
jgi:hypothetical protein